MLQKIVYTILQLSIKVLVYGYYQKVLVKGLGTIPKKVPILFLPNHQNALLDVLLLGVTCGRKPYFLARSDVFSNPLLSKIFRFIKMIPIYRIRDGRDTLKKNEDIFETCAKKLHALESVVLFPEGSHNLKRRVRPLSKGFIRIVSKSLSINPKLDFYIVPVGFNYNCATDFPDQVAIYYGEPLSIKSFVENGKIAKPLELKEAVANALKLLTTHIEDEEHYEIRINQLHNKQLNFLNPNEVYTFLKQPCSTEKIEKIDDSNSIWYYLFSVINFPVILLWRMVIKPKIKEIEFLSTFRFATAILGGIVYYTLLLLLGLYWNSLPNALIILSLLMFYNILYKTVAK